MSDAPREQDVDRFLWEVEKHLSHVDGEERLKLVREAERLLLEEAARVAGGEGADDLTWYHYVQASANIGPPERLAAQLSGRPLPDLPTVRRRRWIVVWALAGFIVVILAYAFLTQGDLQTIGAWSAREDGVTRTEELDFTVSADARSVFFLVIVTPATREGTAHVTVLDGDNGLVYTGDAAGDDALEAAEYLRGAPGTWRAFIDFEDFTGVWRISARQEV